MTTLIAPADTVWLWTAMVAGTAAAIRLEASYRWAARLSGPVLALLFAMLGSGLRLMPPEAPAYDFVGQWLVPLAIPLLLLRANLIAIVRTTGRLFLVFHLAAAGTVVGTFVAVSLFQSAFPKTDLIHAAGLMSASYVGGGVNFVAIKQSHQIAETVANPLLVADNFVMAAVFVALLSLAGSKRWQHRFQQRQRHAATGTTESSPPPPPSTQSATTSLPPRAFTALDLAIALTVAFVAVAAADLGGRQLRHVLHAWETGGWFAQMAFVLCTNKFVLLTSTSVTIASLFPRQLAGIECAGTVGSYLLYLFLFTLGLPADLAAVLGQAPLYFLFCGTIAATNVALTLVVGWLLRWPLDELLLSINASIGGAPTAAAMAVSAQWPNLVLPGLLIGIWGYAIGTPIGLLVIELLNR